MKEKGILHIAKTKSQSHSFLTILSPKAPIHDIALLLVQKVGSQIILSLFYEPNFLTLPQMNKVFGYARVSTIDQNLDTQIEALNKFGCGRIFQDKITGLATQRPALDEMLPFFGRAIHLSLQDSFVLVGAATMLSV